MNFKRKLLAIIVSAFILVSATACGGDGAGNECTHTWGEWQTKTQATCTAEGVKERICTLCEESENDVTNKLSHDWIDATCKAPKTCKNCQATEGTQLSHTFENIVKSQALKSAATCSSPAIYYKSCACGTISDTETFTRGNTLPHNYNQEIVKDEAIKVKATCTTPALYYFSCECGAFGGDDVFEYGDIAHYYDKEVVKADALKTQGEGDELSVYYKSCVCGLVSETETFEVKTMVGKNILIFGDSYSSYVGTIPDGYRVYYSGTNILNSPDQMWWSLLVQERGGTVVRNDSSSGSTINKGGYHPFINRLNKLYDEGFFEENQIDYVFVLGGTNDNGGHVLGEEMYSGWTDSDLNKVLPAICYFFSRIREILPNAEIYGITNLRMKQELIDAIDHATAHVNGHFVGIKVELESSHPTAVGMQQIKDEILKVFDK